MNTIIVNIICEGQTEDLFVRQVLKPFFINRGIVLKSRILLTSKKKNQRGGMISYSQAIRDVKHWISENNSKNSEKHYYTTMFDFYALPADFPGMTEASKHVNAYDKVYAIEKSMSEDFQADCFIPYIQLHEFESLLLSDVPKIAERFPKEQRTINSFQVILKQCYENPELVNTGRQTAPSKRISDVVERNRNYKYHKVQDGVYIAGQIGMDRLLSSCRHFSEWINKLIDCSE